jgi:hypothetical protein
MLSGGNPEDMLRCVKAVIDQKFDWIVPSEYAAHNVSNTVTKIVLAYH